jgi:hypothetical protein
MPRAPGPNYDSFVVRLWHEGGGRLLRAEVEHLQTGAIHVGRGIVPSWILGTLRACVRNLPPKGRADSVEWATEEERDDASVAKRT